MNARETQKMSKPPQLFEKASICFYLLLAFVAFVPSLLGGKAYFDGDLISFNVPVWDFLKDCFSRGHCPLWEPYLMAGQPCAADPGTMFFYPPAYLNLLPSKALGSGLFYAFHLFLSAIGIDFWFQKVGLPPGARRLGAVIFALSGFFWWEIIHPQVLAGYAWLPWWLGALEELIQCWKRRWAFAAGFFLGLIFLCGHFQIFLGAVYGGGIYFIFRLWRSHRSGAARKLEGKIFPPLMGAFAWGLLPALALAVPFLEFSSLTGRLQEAHDYLSFNAGYSDNPDKLFRFLFPNPYFSRYGMSGDLLENAGFLGIWFFFLGAMAFRNLRWRPWVWFWCSWGVAGILVSLGQYTPFHRWLCDYVLGFGFMRAPYRFIYLYALSGAFLAAMGWAFWEKQEKDERKRTAWMGWGYAALVLGLAVAVFHGQSAGILGLILGCVGLGWGAWGGRKAKIGEGVFLVGLSLSMISSGWRTCPSHLGPESNFNFAKNCPELVELKQKTGLGRTFIDGDIPYSVEAGGRIWKVELPTNAVYTLGIRDVQGYNPISLWSTNQIFSLPFETAVRLMAVESIAQGTRKAFAPPGFALEKTGPVYFYYAKKPFPFVYAPTRVAVVESDQERLARMGGKDFNPYQLSYLSSPPPKGLDQGNLARSNGLSYRLTQDDPDDQTFKVRRSRAGWTVFSEVVYPGWKAWVDGARAELLTANHVFRAVWVPAGEHEVRFSYEPVWWTPIRVGLVLWFLSVLGLVWRPWRKWTLGDADPAGPPFPTKRPLNLPGPARRGAKDASGKPTAKFSRKAGRSRPGGRPNVRGRFEE